MHGYTKVREGEREETKRATTALFEGQGRVHLLSIQRIHAESHPKPQGVREEQIYRTIELKRSSS